MKVIKTKFEGLFVISYPSHNDNRGVFKEVFRESVFKKNIGKEINFCQENIVYSSNLVLRGLHFQKNKHAQSKLIFVSSGEILDVAVDIRKESKTYGQYFSEILSSKCNKSIFIPKGFAHGYLTLSETATVHYRVDEYYNKESESGILFNDKKPNIDWKVDIKKIKLSKKDRNFKKFNW